MKALNRAAAFAVLAGAAALSACTSGQSAVEPTISPANVAAQSTLQFAVGTANIGGLKTGLNTVVTFRQAGGLSAVLFDKPTITGPTGFLVASASAGVDNGTNMLSNSGNPPLGSAAPTTTFGLSGGAFAYGFAPQNSTTSGGATYTQYSEPLFSSVPDPASTATPQATIAVQPLGGPPLFPNVRNGTYPAGFVGYGAGFTAFDSVAVAAGTYGLAVSVPSGNNSTSSFTATGTLTSTAPLGTIAPATFAYSGTNSLAVTFTVPAGVTEATVYVRDVTAGVYYSARTTAVGVQTIVFPDGLGPVAFGATTPSPTIPNGDKVVIEVIGYDYPQFAAALPASTITNPVITGAAGQSDLTMSIPTTIVKFAHP